MDISPEIQDFTYIRRRLSMDNWRKANVYRGLITKNDDPATLVYQFLHNTDIPAELDFFENHHKGFFTLKFDGRGSIVHFANGDDTSMQGVPNLGINNEAANKIVELRIENEKLKFEVMQLREQLEEFQDHGSKFGYALGKAAEFLFPQLRNEMPMQGTPNTNNTMEDLENALGILLDKFGDEWLIKFANHCQNNPNVVDQVKTYFR